MDCHRMNTTGSKMPEYKLTRVDPSGSTTTVEFTTECPYEMSYRLLVFLRSCGGDLSNLDRVTLSDFDLNKDYWSSL